MALVKFDIASSKIFVTNINPTVIRRYSIIALSNNEVFYSYTTEDNPPYRYYHVVHAKYKKPRNKSIDTLKELYHQSYKGNFNAISKIDENTNTIWSASGINDFHSTVYLQYNITDHTLIGSNYTYHSNDYHLEMHVAGEIV